MKTDIELTIVEKNNRWVARNQEFEIIGTTLNELDENLKNELLKRSKYSKGTQVTVFMGCDSHIMPAWMRPYQSHYFNRIVTINL